MHGDEESVGILFNISIAFPSHGTITLKTQLEKYNKDKEVIGYV